VPVETWRDHLFSAGLLDAKASNPRQDFKRLRDGLSDKDQIREWDGLMWAVQSKTDEEICDE
jgi:hypothetical protein